MDQIKRKTAVVTDDNFSETMKHVKEMKVKIELLKELESRATEELENRTMEEDEIDVDDISELVEKFSMCEFYCMQNIFNAHLI